MKGFLISKNNAVHTTVHINVFKKLFSDPKLYIAKDKKTGKPDVTKPWHVYYYFRNPITQKMEKFSEKQNINRIKTVRERKIAGKNLCKALLRLLQEGYNPFELQGEKENSEKLVNKETYTVKEAFELAINEKNKEWAEGTRDVNKVMYNNFVKWLENNNLLDIDIKDLTRRHIVLFLNQLKTKENKAVSNTTRNNNKRFISSLITKIVDDEILERNFAKKIPLLKAKPEKNRPYSKKQLRAIKAYLLENDMYLYNFMQFVMYGLLRPVEVCRLEIRDIDLESNIITVRSKTEIRSTVLIIEPLRKLLLKMNLKQYSPSDNLFSNKLKPSLWKTEKEKSKVDFFSRRFKKLKKAIGEKINLDANHTIYSSRHTVALDLYFSFKKQGLTDLEAKHKLMTITRHKSLSGLESYLREIGASLPKDYSKDYSIDF